MLAEDKRAPHLRSQNMSSLPGTRCAASQREKSGELFGVADTEPPAYSCGHHRSMAYVRRIAMRQSAQLVLFVSLTFFTGAAHAVDRGQFENVPDDVRTWFKGVRMGIARSTTYEGELIGFQSMVCGGRCRKRRSFETPEIRLAKPSFGMSIFAVISRSAALSRPMPRERCGDTFCQRMRRSQSWSSFRLSWYLGSANIRIWHPLTIFWGTGTVPANKGRASMCAHL